MKNENEILKYNMENSFLEIGKVIKDLENKTFKCSMDRYAQQEILRFYSIAGTILDNFTSDSLSIDERNITHPLLRSLLDGYIWLLYINWESNKDTRLSRFNELMDGFKIEYNKLIEDPDFPRKDEIPSLPSDENWSELKKPRNTRDLLVALKNDNGDRLDYQYFAFRIMSFDTHAKASGALFTEAFGQKCNFAYIKPSKLINLIANYYLEVISKHL